MTTEREQRSKLYRVVSDPSWRVEYLYRGSWTVAYYCSSEDSAKSCIKKCIDRRMRWESLSQDERMNSVLR